MNARAREVLKQLIGLEELDEPDMATILRERGSYWFGMQRLRFSTVADLLRCTAITESYSSGDRTTFVVTSTGRAINRRPALSYEVESAIRAKTPFTIRDDHVVPLEDPHDASAPTA